MTSVPVVSPLHATMMIVSGTPAAAMNATSFTPIRPRKARFTTAMDMRPVRDTTTGAASRAISARW